MIIITSDIFKIQKFEELTQETSSVKFPWFPWSSLSSTFSSCHNTFGIKMQLANCVVHRQVIKFLMFTDHLYPFFSQNFFMRHTEIINDEIILLFDLSNRPLHIEHTKSNKYFLVVHCYLTECFQHTIQKYKTIYIFFFAFSSIISHYTHWTHKKQQ